MKELPETLVRALRQIVAPLVEADGGVLYRIESVEGLMLHLGGACAGCPGFKTTTLDVIEPALRASGYRGSVAVTGGWIVPDGAERIASET